MGQQPVDFTTWTDAQLQSAVTMPVMRRDPQFGALQAEWDKRQASGSDDGSRQRVADLLASNRRHRAASQRRARRDPEYARRLRED